MNEIRGTIKEIIPYGNFLRLKVYVTESSIENAKLPSMMTVVGGVDDGEEFPRVGYEYLFTGTLKRHEKFGWQFNFDGFCETTPVSDEQLIDYIAEFAVGIKSSRAAKLVDAHGKDSLEILRTDPQKVASVTKCTIDQAIETQKIFIEKKKTERVLIELIGLLKDYSLPKKLPFELIKRFGASAITEIRSNPFIITEFKGVGFLKADKLYLGLGGSSISDERFARCMIHCMDEDRNGSVWHNPSDIANAMRKLLEVEFSTESIVEYAKSKKLLVQVDGYIAMMSEAVVEEKLAQEIVRLSGEPSLWPNPFDSEIFTIQTEHQRHELAKAFRSKLSVFVGRPGTGKTTTTAPVIKYLSQTIGGDCIAYCTPTGKAASRSREVLRADGIDDVTPSTIHSLLVAMPSGGGFRFEFNAENKLDVKVVVVDEISMIPQWLMLKLFEALPDDCHILLVGDPEGQLSPVGTGAPARDMLRSSLSSGNLSQIHRNAGSIVEFCSRVRDKQDFVASLDYKPDPYGKSGRKANLIHVNSSSGTTSRKKVTEICSMIIEQSLLQDPKNDIQVIVPLNTRTQCSRENLNRDLQSLFNPSGESINENFRIGDKIVCLENKLVKSLDSKTAVRINNGDFGVITGASKKTLECEFYFPLRHVEIPILSGLVELGYAATCHKMQGSQIPVGIVVLDDSFMACGRDGLVDANWLETAVTRSQLITYLVGSIDDMRRVAGRSYANRRRTFLKDFIDIQLTERHNETRTTTATA